MRSNVLPSACSGRVFRTILQWVIGLGVIGTLVITLSQPSNLMAAVAKSARVATTPAVRAATPTRSATPNLTRNARPASSGTQTPVGPALPQASSAPVVIGRSPRAFTVDANTVALYHLDAQVGDKVLDATGNYTGTLYGNATITSTGLFSGALSMDGIANPGSYVRLGYLGNLVSGTVEAFVDFQHACVYTDVLDYITIVSAGSEFGGGQTVLALATLGGGLGFGIYADGRWEFANSGINPCRYLIGGNLESYFYPWPVRWPYEAWRFHHVAGTWGPNGIEIWVDGVLHGVNFRRDFSPPESYSGLYMCNPQDQINPSNPDYPKCHVPQPGLQPNTYAGGIPAYSTFLIGTGNYFTVSAPFKGRIDEVRISNIQRTFTWDVVPASTPVPTQTPDRTSSEYSVDGYTMGLYHLNAVGSWNSVKNEVTQLWNAGLKGNATIVSNGHFNAGLSLDGNLSYVKADPLNVPYYGTAEAWINPSPTYSPYMIMALGTEPGSGYYGASMFLGMENLGTIRFGIQNNGTWYWADSGINYSALTGCWHHVAGTWGQRGVEIWLDGELKAANSFPGYPAYGSTYMFGCDAWSRCFKGRMDEVRLSNVQRSFAPPSAAARSRASMVDGTLTFLPMIRLAPTPTCPYG